MTNEELVRLIQAGTDAKTNMQRLYEQNRGYICKVISRYARYESMEDLMQEAYFGLARAVELWTGEAGIDFMTYAHYWIKQAAQRYIENCGSCIRIPVHRRGEINQYMKAVNAFYMEHGREPTERETAALLRCDTGKVDELRRSAALLQLRSLSEPIPGTEDSLTLIDIIPDPADAIRDADQRLNDAAMASTLWALIDQLDPQEQEMLKHRYIERKTIKECAADMGASVAIVRRLEKKALHNLRRGPNGRKLRPYLDDYTAARAYSGTGYSAYISTGASVQERIIMRNEERAATSAADD